MMYKLSSGMVASLISVDIVFAACAKHSDACDKPNNPISLEWFIKAIYGQCLGMVCGIGLKMVQNIG